MAYLRKYVFPFGSRLSSWPPPSRLSVKWARAVRFGPAISKWGMIELQQLIGKINFIRRFISNLSGWIEPFVDLVKIKADEEFRWGAEQQ
jgi:hypothetical protein